MKKELFKMIRSMTGYGRAQDIIDNTEITAEIKAVNHRYFEFSCRLPRQYSFLEDKIKSLISGRVSRGKCEVFISINKLGTEGTEVAVNHALAKAYVNALREISVTYSLKEAQSATDITKYQDVLTVRRAEEDEDALFSAVSSVVSSALDSFIKMRETEGAKLKDDILSRCETILKSVDFIEQKSGETVNSYRARLEEKMKELLGDVKVDEQRLLTETAIFADKIAVDEETVRLRSHIEQLNSMMTSNEAIGRKLDFLLQEMNREVNTTGSKSANVEITRVVVDVKSELEKIREQIQNIE